MIECPDCYEKVGSALKHRSVCVVKNNKTLRQWLESIEFWLTRMERHLNHAYRSITRYTHAGKQTSEREQAKEEYQSAAEMIDRIPLLLERIGGSPCERVASAQLRASILTKQVLEVRMILHNLR